MNDRQWTGVVLAGGQSKRMGRDKALIEFPGPGAGMEGRTLLDRTIELLRPHAREILVIGDPARYAPEHGTVVPDDTPGQGPLGGLLSAMRRARYVRMLVLACDLPGINDRLLVLLKRELTGEVDAVVPRHDALIEPLAAAYHKHGIEAIQEQVRSGKLKMSDTLDRLRTRYVQVEPGKDGWPADLFKNVNAPSDL